MTTATATLPVQTAVKEKSGIMFKRSSLSGYSLLPKPGKWKVTVANNVDERSLYKDEKSGQVKYIINLKALAPDQYELAKDVFRDKEEVEIEETNKLFLTASVWVNGNTATQELPLKGEVVEAFLGFVKNREGMDVLRITGLRVGKALEAVTIDLEDMFAPAPAPGDSGAEVKGDVRPGELKH